MKKFLISSVVLVILAGALILGACAPASPTTTGPIVLGWLASYTGPNSATQPWEENAIELAIADIGGQINGRSIKVVKEDTAADPAKAVEIARKFVEVEKADVLFGPLPANDSAAVGAYSGPAGLVHLGQCEQIRAALKQGPYEFSPDGTHKGTGYYVGLYAYDVLGARTATVIHDDIAFSEDFTQGAMDGFVSRGGTIIQRQRTPMDAQDYASYLTAMEKADVVIYWFVPPHALRFNMQYQQYGFTMPRVQGGCTTMNDAMQQDLGEKGVGIATAASCEANVDTPTVKAFVDRWLKMHGDKPADKGRTPDYNEGLTMYNSVYIYLQAVKMANGDTTPAKVGEILATKKFDTPWDKVSFDNNHVAIGNKYVLVITNVGGKYIRTAAKVYEQVSRDIPAEAEGKAPKM